MNNDVLIFVGDSGKVPRSSTKVARAAKPSGKKIDLGARRMLVANFAKPPPAPAGFTSIQVAKLKDNMQQFIGTVRDILDAPANDAGPKLKTFDVAVAISGEGSVGFFGTGVKTTASGTLTLHFEVA
jgi:hypothetical protein